MTFKDELLDEDYFYNNSEAHRRRPTLVLFPQLVVHTATFYETPAEGEAQRGKKEQDGAAKFLAWLTEQFSADWRRRPPIEQRQADGQRLPSDKDAESDERTPYEKWAAGIPFKPDFLRRFANAHENERTLRKKQPADDDVEFIFEARHRAAPEIVVRVEAHSEFFSITFFSPIATPETPLKDTFDAAAARFFPKDSLQPAESDTPHQVLLRSVAKHFEQSTFAHFTGVVTDCRCFGGVTTDGLFHESNAPLAEFLAKASAHAGNFLRDVRAHLDNSVFINSDNDAIACYVQRGRAMYISTLGAQASPTSKDEVRYLVLYERPEVIERECGVPKPDPRRRAHLERFRLSRLVYRLNTIGTLRLAALRELRRMRATGDRLREIEDALEAAAYRKSALGGYGARDRELLAVIHELEKMADGKSAEGSPILHRAARTRHYWEQIQRLLDDMDVGEIATWQTYHQFIHRRLATTLEYVASINTRVTDVWNVARSRLELIESRTLLWLQKLSTAASLALLPLAVADYLQGKLPDAFRERLEQACAATGWIRVMDPAPATSPQTTAPASQGEALRQPAIEMPADDLEFWALYVLALAVWVLAVLWMRYSNNAVARLGGRRARRRHHDG